MLDSIVVPNRLLDGDLLDPPPLLVLHNFPLHWHVLYGFHLLVVDDCPLVGNVLESGWALIRLGIPWISATPSLIYTGLVASGRVNTMPDGLSDGTGGVGAVEAGFCSEAIIL